MKKKFFITLFCIFASFCLVSSSIVYLTYLSKDTTFAKILSTPQTKYTHWVAIEPDFTPDFYYSKDAVRIGNNVLLFQSDSGGWNKNIHMDAKFNIFEKIYIIYDKSLRDAPTIDNTATTTEIDYLSKLYNATHKKKYKKAVIRGLKYLLKMQLDNGGFPQSFPFIQHEYQKYITFNDCAMVNVLSLFYKIIDKDPQYDFIKSHLRKKIKKSFDKGLQCLLKTQLPVGGWASQYNHITMEPANARTYELAAVDSRETANAIIFLVKIKNPSENILQSIEKAVKWLNENKIENFQFAYHINDDGLKDFKLDKCQNCPPIWARLYDLSTNTPIFSDRSGKKYENIEEISYERRNNYEWYVIDGRLALEEYQAWKALK